MSKEQFVEKNFSQKSRDTLKRVTTILDEYSMQGYKLTVRQVFYQLVARGFVANKQRIYKNLVNLISHARLAGFIDWAMIEDRNRETYSPPMWDSPAEIVDSAASQFAVDRWQDQDNSVEVMVEKAALEGVLIPVCRELGIRFTANRGYCSQSLLYEMGKRLYHIRPKNCYVLYLGDLDPSGVDMSRDVQDRLSLFSHDNVEVRRLALNMDQIQLWHPPENPAKQTDTRFYAYQREFGDSSWELDAVEPVTLGKLVKDAVAELRDDDLYNAQLQKEERMRKELWDFASEYRNKEWKDDKNHE